MKLKINFKDLHTDAQNLMNLKHDIFLQCDMVGEHFQILFQEILVKMCHFCHFSMGHNIQKGKKISKEHYIRAQIGRAHVWTPVTL